VPDQRALFFACLSVVMGCDGSHSPSPPPAISTSKSLSQNVPETQESMNAHPWRSDPALAGMFHPEYPDDLQVIVHEGGPRLTQARPELIWVRVIGMRGTVYVGMLLNQPHQLTHLKQNDSILFLAVTPINKPYLVTEKYLRERSEWHIRPCNQCGMPDLFDAPSDLQAKIFPGVPSDAKMEAFTSFCPLCGGVQLISSSPFDEVPSSH